MAERARDELKLRIVGTELPGTECGQHRGVHLGLQLGREPGAVVPASGAQVVFETAVETWLTPDGTPDFRGPAVQGKRGARFLYLTWGELPPGGTFAMFRRAKLALGDIPAAVLERGRKGATLEARLGLTDRAGLPVCASVHPPAIAWVAVK